MSLTVFSFFVLFIQNAFALERCKTFLGIVEVPKLFGTVFRDTKHPEEQKKPEQGAVVQGSFDLEGKEKILLKKASDVSAEEFGYELTGAIVCRRKENRFGIKDAHGNIVWISDVGPFYSYFELVKLGSLAENWEGKLWPEPGRGMPRLVKSPKGKEMSLLVKVEEEKFIGGELWFRVVILPKNECTDEKQSVQGTGWVPAHQKNGKPLVIHHPRGC